MAESQRAFVSIGEAQIDQSGRQWIEVIPTANEARNGPYFTTVTREDLDTYAQSLEASAGRVVIDYDHEGDKDRSTRAAGWFTGQARIEDRDYGAVLLAEVQWTPRAAQEIRDGEWRFTSPVYSFQKKDPKSGLMTKAKAIVASTLTNRPFYKQLAALATLEPDDPAIAALAEYFATKPEDIQAIAAGVEGNPETKARIRAAMESIEVEVNDNSGRAADNEGADMELKAIAAALGLSEDATEEQIATAAKAAQEKAAQADILKTEVDTLKAAAETVEPDRIKKLEDALAASEKKRVDAEVTADLKAAVSANQIVPAQSAVLAEQFDGNPEGLRALLATFPARARLAAGSGGSGETGEQTDKAAHAATERFDQVNEAGRKVAAPQEQIDAHVLAEKKLVERGKHKYTSEEYLEAYAEAEAELELTAA